MQSPQKEEITCASLCNLHQDTRLACLNTAVAAAAVFAVGIEMKPAPGSPGAGGMRRAGAPKLRVRLRRQ